jgi:hypothetical protein
MEILIASAEKINFIFARTEEAAMTEPVTGIDKARVTGKKNAPDTRLKHEKAPRHTDETGEDSIDISEEARDRAAGRRRKKILDYLNEEPASPWEQGNAASQKS